MEAQAGGALDGSVARDLAAAEKTYMQLDEISHVLARPGMYIGATRPVVQELEILYDAKTKQRFDEYAVHNNTVKLMVTKNAEVPKWVDVDTCALVVDDEKQAAMSSMDATVRDASDVNGATESDAAPVVVKKPKKTRDAFGSGLLTAPISSGLLRLLIEALQNAVDAAVEDETVTKIMVSVDDRHGGITVENNGKGIPVEKAKASDIYVPEMVFGNLRAGSNFGDVQGGDGKQRMGSGLNGVGITLANIFSRTFTASTRDMKTMTEWSMMWKNSSRDKTVAKIKSHSKKSGNVCVTFYPDMKHFEVGPHPGETIGDETSEQVVFKPHVSAALRACAYDLVAVVPDRVSVYVDGERVPLRGITDYARVMGGALSRSRLLTFESVGSESGPNGSQSRMDVVVMLASPQTPRRPVGFVNGLRCSLGAHIDHVTDVFRQVVAAVAKEMKRAGAEDIAFSREKLKQILWFVVSVRVPNPHFKSQTKDELDMLQREMGVRLRLVEGDIKALKNMCKPAVKNMMQQEKATADVLALQKTAALAKGATVNSVSASIFGNGGTVHHPKLRDAPNAGQRHKFSAKRQKELRDHVRRLYVAEGDSAGELVKCGLSASKDPDNCGVLVARGKILNVRNSDLKKIGNNEFIVLLAKVLGLVPGKVYHCQDDLKDLRYDTLIAFADQDGDGHHIVGLLMNAVDYLFPGLVQLKPDFVRRFATPVVRCGPRRAGLPDKTFLTLQEFDTWYTPEQHRDYPPAKIRYLKGLGGSAGPEAREYFKSEHKLCVTLTHTGFGSEAALNLLFHDALADERKKMLAGVEPDCEMVANTMATRRILPSAYQEQDGAISEARTRATQDIVKTCMPHLVYKVDSVFDYSRGHAAFEEYAGKAVAHFSWEDVERSMPDLSGMKEVHRKILHGFIVKNIWTTRKLGVAVAECTAASHYTHGEQSITEAAVGMAQMHMGTNNVSILKGVGMFGTRNNAPTKHAAARYLSVHLHPVSKCLFPADDSPVLVYKEEEGRVIEPEQYAPVIPLILVNGASGIATGWSTTVPPHRPSDVLQATRELVSMSLRHGGSAVLGRDKQQDVHASALVSRGEVSDRSQVDASALIQTHMAAGPRAGRKRQRNSTTEIEDGDGDGDGDGQSSASLTDDEGQEMDEEHGDETSESHAFATLMHDAFCPQELHHVRDTDEYREWQAKTNRLVPWADMYRGGVEVTKSSVVWYGKYKVGVAGDDQVNRNADLVMITIEELPYGCWTSSWKKRLYQTNFINPPPPLVIPTRESALAKKLRFVRDARVQETDATVHIQLLCDASALAAFIGADKQHGKQILQQDQGAASSNMNLRAGSSAVAHEVPTWDEPRYPELERALRLCTRMSKLNMHLFDHNHCLRRVSHVHEVYLCHFALRHWMYCRRMQYITQQCKLELARCSNKYRFVCMVIAGELNLIRKSVAAIDGELCEKGFTSDQELQRMQPRSSAPGHRNSSGQIMMRPDEHAASTTEVGNAYDADVDASQGTEDMTGKTYTYLRRMHMDSVSSDLLKTLKRDSDHAQQRLDQVTSMKPEDLWLKELDVLEAALADAQQDKHNEYYSLARSGISDETKAPKGRRKT